MNRIAIALVGASLVAAAPAFAQSMSNGTMNRGPVQIPDRQVAAMYHDESTPAEHRETMALNTLEANGYDNFSNLKQSGSNFTADVSRDGRQFQVTVDPDSGSISR